MARGRNATGGLVLVLLAVAALGAWFLRGNAGSRGDARDGNGKREAVPSRNVAPDAVAERGEAGDGGAPPDAGASGPSASREADEPLDRFAPDAVFGWVHSASDAPVVGAHLELFEQNRNAPFCTRRVAESTTDPAGRFRFAELPEFHAYHLRIEAEHEIPVVHLCHTGVAAHLTLAPCVEIAGQVFDADSRRPIPGVVLKQSISYGSERILEQETVTDPEGRYRIPVEPQGSGLGSSWAVARPGHLLQVHDFSRAIPGKPHDLYLASGKELRGIVVDGETGEPLAGARIVAWGWGIELAETGGSGAFHVLAPASTDDEDSALLEVEAEGYCRVRCALPFVLEAPATPLLPLLRGSTVSGIVVDENRDPVPGVRVTIDGDDEATVRELPASVHLTVNVPENWQTVQRYAAVPALTDAEGRFDLIALPPRKESLDLGFDCPGHLPVRHDVPLDRTGQQEFVEVILPAVAESGEIRGTVTVNGTPRPAWVACEVSGYDQRVRTSDRGDYAFTSVPAGDCHLRVEVRSWGRITDRARPALEREVRLAAHAILTEDFALACEQDTVAGTVTREHGTPVAGIPVLAWWEDRNSESIGRATTDAEGRFLLTLDRLPSDEAAPAGVVVSASEGFHSENLRATAGQEDVHLVLPELGWVEIHALDAESRARVPSLDIAWRASGSTNSFGRCSRSVRAMSSSEEIVLRVQVPVGIADLRVDGAPSGYSLAFARSIPVQAGSTSTAAVNLSRTARLRVQQAPDAALGARGFVFLLREDEVGCVREGAPGNYNLRLNGKEFLVDPDSRIAACLPARLLSFGKAVQTFEQLLPGTYHFRSFIPGLHVEPSTIVVDFDTPPVSVRLVKEE